MIEFGWVALWYIGSVLLAALSFPITFFFCTKLPDRGYAISRIVSLVLMGFIAFLLGYLKTPIAFSWPFSILALAGVSGWLAKKNWNEMKHFVHENRKLLLTLEICFVLSFAWFTFVRSLTPGIDGSEKFMDFGIFNAAQRTEKLPIYDFWISGDPLRYYWFSHFVFGKFSQTLFTPEALGYNLTIILVFAITVTVAFSLGLTLTKKWYWSLLGVGFIAFFGNISSTIQIFWRPWERYDFWLPSRGIEGQIAGIAGTINEFPFFTFFLSDLHAHLLAIPIVLAILYLFYQIYQEGPTINNSILTTILLGCLRVANAWDWPALVALLGVILLARWWQNGRKEAFLKSIVFPWALITGISFAVFFGFPQPQQLSIKIASIHSIISEWLLVYGSLFLLIIAYILSNFRWAAWAILAMLVVTMFILPVWIWLILLLILLIFIFLNNNPDKELSFGLILTITTCCILIGIEWLFINDWLAASWQRMNTVFKFGLHSWYLLSISIPVLMAAAWKQTENKKLALGCLLGLIVLSGLVYPAVILSQRYKWSPGLTIYGLNDQKRFHPADHTGISWLRQQKGTPIVLEATGEAYRYNGRVSAYTGLPTLSGWPGHLFQHGVPWDTIFKRRDDVNKIYQSESMDIAMPILKNYNVTYIFVGEEETKQFNASTLAKFKVLPKAFEAEGVVIYRVG
jgi:YYY domain-containing protein